MDPVVQRRRGWGQVGSFPGDGNGPITGDANIVVQVFDCSEGRLVGETRQSGYALGITTWQVATGALHTALDRVVPELLRLLGAQAS